MKKFGHRVISHFKDESGQGATEYILLLVVVVALALMFRNSITKAIGEKLTQLSGDIGAFTGQGQ